MLLSTATLLFADVLSEKFSEQFLSQPPVLLVDTVFHLWSFYLSLYQSGIFQFREVLRYRGFRNGQFLVYITEIAGLLLCKKLDDSNTCRMSQSLCKARQLFLSVGIFFFLVHNP